MARAYGRVYAAVAAAGRKARGRRATDLLIAATAVAANTALNLLAVVVIQVAIRTLPNK